MDYTQHCEELFAKLHAISSTESFMQNRVSFDMIAKSLPKKRNNYKAYEQSLALMTQAAIDATKAIDKQMQEIRNFSNSISYPES